MTIFLGEAGGGRVGKDSFREHEIAVLAVSGGVLHTLHIAE